MYLQWTKEELDIVAQIKVNPLYPNIDQYPYSPHSSLYVYFALDKENLYYNQSILG